MKPLVYVVDDEERMCQVVSMVLERTGYEVRGFTDPREALSAVDERPPDLLITDFSMPAMDGIEVLRAVKRRDAAVPVVLITAHATVQSAIAAFKEGVFDYLLKPFANEDLKNIVGNAMELGRLARENKYLHSELRSKYLVDGMIAESPEMLAIIDLVRRVAESKATVLVTGESGTGKELIARAIHFNSRRVGGPFVAVNCKALAESVLEAELFGYEKGAFTGAAAQKSGRFELADQGTLFLDEIGEVSLNFQGKLLRVLQQGEFERVGGTKTIKVDVRIIAATNRDLAKEVQAGRFREDVYFRLNVIPIRIPPLRERRADVQPLADHFLGRYASECEKNVEGFSQEVVQHLQTYDWPGNVRELENAIERGVVLARHPRLTIDDLLLSPGQTAPAAAADAAGAATAASGPGASGAAGGAAGTWGPSPTCLTTLQEHLDKAAADHIRVTLESTGGKKVRTSEILGINRATLYRLMRKYGLTDTE